MSPIDANRFRTGGALHGKLGASLFQNDEHSFAPGTILGVWRIERLIGQGGMSEVYLATRDAASFDQTVALKIVSAGPDFNERLREERRMLAKLKHPGIASLIDGGELEDGRAWFAMEYVAGVRLDQYVASRKLKWDECVALFESLCSAVMHAHAHLLVHRDIKPANVMVDDQGRLRLLDFGIAIPAAEKPDPSDRFMTPGFAAPEQLNGGDITTATDIFQLGETLRRITLGSDTFDAAGMSRSIRQGLSAIISCATKAEPTQRYDSVARLREDLQALRQYLPVRAVHGSAMYQADLFIRRHPRSAALVAVLCVIAVVSAVQLTQSLAREAEERRTALKEEHTAKAIGTFFVDLFQDPSLADGGVAGLLDRGQQRLLANQREAPETRAALLHALALANVRMDRPNTARPLLTEAITLQRGLGKTARTDLALSLASLARIQFLDGDSQQALANAAEAQQLLDSPGAPESHARFLALSEIANVHLAALQFAPADVLLERAVDLGTRRYGSESPQLFDVRRMQIDSLRNQWQVEKALPLSEAFVATCARLLGESDPACIVEQINHARLRAHAGELDRAEKTYRELLSHADEWTGKQRIYRTHAVLFDLSETLWLQGKYNEAKETLERSLEKLKEAEGGSGPHWDSDRGALALLLIEMGDPDTAYAITGSRPARDPKTPAVTEDHFWIGRHAQAELELDKVSSQTRQALVESAAAMAEIYGPKSYFTGQAMLVLARVAAKAGDAEEAKRLLNLASKTELQGLAMHHPRLKVDVALARASLAKQEGNNEAAQRHREEALTELPQALYPSQHPLRAALEAKILIEAPAPLSPVQRDQLEKAEAILAKSHHANSPLLAATRAKLVL